MKQLIGTVIFLCVLTLGKMIVEVFMPYYLDSPVAWIVIVIVALFTTKKVIGE